MKIRLNLAFKTNRTYVIAPSRTERGRFLDGFRNPSFEKVEGNVRAHTIVGVSRRRRKHTLRHSGLVFGAMEVPQGRTGKKQRGGRLFIGVMGTIYAVLLAFVVSVLWSQFQQVNVIATQEANQIGDMSV